MFDLLTGIEPVAIDTEMLPFAIPLVGGFIKDALGGIARIGTNAVRGVGRLARGNFGEAFSDLAPAAAALMIPGVGGALGSLGGLAGGALGSIPGAGAIGGALSSIPGAGAIGSLGSKAAGALGSLGDLGGDALGALGNLSGAQMASLPFAAHEIYQGHQDRGRSRELVNNAMGFGQQSADIAMDQFNQTAPMRQEFISGAMGLRDPTNPFSFGGGMGAPAPPQPQPQPEIQPNINVGTPVATNPQMSPLARVSGNALGAIAGSPGAPQAMIPDGSMPMPQSEAGQHLM